MADCDLSSRKNLLHVMNKTGCESLFEQRNRNMDAFVNASPQMRRRHGHFFMIQQWIHFSYIQTSNKLASRYMDLLL